MEEGGREKAYVAEHFLQSIVRQSGHGVRVVPVTHAYGVMDGLEHTSNPVHINLRGLRLEGGRGGERRWREGGREGRGEKVEGGREGRGEKVEGGREGEKVEGGGEKGWRRKGGGRREGERFNKQHYLAMIIINGQ